MTKLTGTTILKQENTNRQFFREFEHSVTSLKICKCHPHLTIFPKAKRDPKNTFKINNNATIFGKGLCDLGGVMIDNVCSVL